MEIPIVERLIYADGEMAERVRSFDWSSTVIGPISLWPTALLTSVNLILDSGFPMVVMWGEEKIQLYNDAYLKILGSDENSKDPQIFGHKAEESWPETWPIVGPLLDSVLQSGKSVYLEDQLIPIYRNGKLDDVYWTFSYNPIRGAYGKPEGILVVCTETTKIKRLLEENEQQLQRVLDHMAEGVGITDTSGAIVYSNPMAHQILSTDPNVFPERRSNSPEWFNTHLDGTPMQDAEHPTMVAIATGKPVFDYEFCIQEPGSKRMYLSMNAAPIIDKRGQITGSVGMFTDITKRKLTERALKEAKDESERQKRLYETIISSTPDLMYVFTLDYKFIYANKALLNMWGKTWDAAVGKGLRENGYEEWHAAMHEREIDEVVATRQSVRGEVAFPHATLGRRMYDYILNPVFDDDGKVVLVAGSTRDITDIKNAEAAMAESEERFRTMAEGSGILIGVGDVNGDVTYFNQPWADLTGKSIDELLGFGWAELVHPEDKDAYTALYMNAVKTRTSYTAEYRIMNATGEYRWLYAFASPRFKPDGSFAGFIGSFIDITERKQDDQRKNDFISMVSHELKTPLTSATSYVQVLHKKAVANGDALTAGMLERTNKQMAKMARLINGFLNVSRLESGKIHIESKRFDMALLVKEAEEESLASITTHKVVFAPVKETWVNADWEKIGQVISNLISNAAKYSPPNSTIKVACVSVGDNALVSVEDQGIGINKDDLPKLFERFYRVTDNDQKNIAGLVLDYTCVAKLLNAITVEFGLRVNPGGDLSFISSYPWLVPCD